jgi:uncharacterized iron-regulated protein
MVEGALRHHPGLDEASLERFYDAQVVWDETMAERIALALSRENAPQRMLVIAGTMHVQSGLGIPRCAARRGIAPFVVVMPIDASDLDETLHAPPIADFLWVVP